MLKLYHAPMACSLASRLALAEAGVPHEIVFVRTWLGENRTEAYLRINPRGKVPALETEHGVLTESVAILPYIADQAPGAGLFPQADAFERARAMAWLSFLSSTLHVALAGAMFAAPGSDNDAALARVVAAFEEVDQHLAGRDHILDGFSVCDLFLLVFGLWRAAPALAGRLPAFPNLDRAQQMHLARPGFAAILGEEMRMRMEAQPA